MLYINGGNTGTCLILCGKLRAVCRVVNISHTCGLQSEREGGRKGGRKEKGVGPQVLTFGAKAHSFGQVPPAFMLTLLPVLNAGLFVVVVV